MNIKNTVIAVVAAGVMAMSSAAVYAQDGGFGRGFLDGRGNGERPVVSAVLDETGLEQREVLQRLRDGETLSQIVESSGGNMDNIEAVVLEQAEIRAAEAVAAGRIDQAQADELLAALSENIDMLGTGELRGRVNQVRGQVAAELESATGLTRDEIIESLRGGATVAELLEANGTSVDAFVDTMMTLAEERAATAVANGRIDQAQADELLAEFETRLTERLNNGIPRPNAQ